MWSDKAPLVTSSAKNAERLVTTNCNNLGLLTVERFLIVSVHVMMSKEATMFGGYHTVWCYTV